MIKSGCGKIGFFLAVTKKPNLSYNDHRGKIYRILTVKGKARDMCGKKVKRQGKRANVCDLKLGEKGVIDDIALPCDLKTRLTELGFTKGAEIECALVSPLGDPIAFKVCDLVMALRQDDAKNILLKQNSACDGKTETETETKAKSKTGARTKTEAQTGTETQTE